MHVLVSDKTVDGYTAPAHAGSHALSQTFASHSVILSAFDGDRPCAGLWSVVVHLVNLKVWSWSNRVYAHAINSRSVVVRPSLKRRGQCRRLVATRRCGVLAICDIYRPSCTGHGTMRWRRAKQRKGVVVEVGFDDRGLGVEMSSGSP